MRKRSGKFYSRNEKETLSKLGLTPAPMSGAGWVIKEDGENETVMVQLKSTDKSSYRIDLLDIKKLEYHAAVSNKLPIFLIQFLKSDKIYALVDIRDIEGIIKEKEIYKEKEKPSCEVIQKTQKEVKKKIVKTSKNSREQFFKERSKKFGKRKRN